MVPLGRNKKKSIHHITRHIWLRLLYKSLHPYLPPLRYGKHQICRNVIPLSPTLILRQIGHPHPANGKPLPISIVCTTILLMGQKAFLEYKEKHYEPKRKSIGEIPDRIKKRIKKSHLADEKRNNQAHANCNRAKFVCGRLPWYS